MKRAIEGYTNCLRRNDDRAFAETTRYQDVLATMKPLMTSTLHNSGDPPELAEVVVKTLEAPRPRMQYRKTRARPFS